MSTFATVQELEAYWRPLDSQEETRATSLLNIASDRLRLLDKTIDDRIALDPILGTAVKSVVMESVKRSMITPTDMPNAESYSQTAGPYSENYKFSNPTGDLFFKKSELRLIGISGTVFTSVSTSRTDIYSDPSEV